jgi:hypothetical protein
MPSALPKMIEERIVAFSIARRGLGCKRVASELAGPVPARDRPPPIGGGDTLAILGTRSSLGCLA